jgi:hypothetical protein
MIHPLIIVLVFLGLAGLIYYLYYWPSRQKKNQNLKLRDDSCTTANSPQCAPNHCTSDADCPTVGGTCCYCNLNTNTCGNGDTCSSCMISCRGDNCCSDCQADSVIDDCSHAGC